MHVYRFFDDATKCRDNPQRHYVFKKGVPQRVPRRRWFAFLHGLERKHLDAGAHMLQASAESDLGEEEMQFLRLLRAYSDVLLLGPEDPWTSYQERLSKLHSLGIINLSLTLVGQKCEPIEQFKARKEHQVRSLAAKLRESRKDAKRKAMAAEAFRKQSEDAKKKLSLTQQLLRHAESQLHEFQHLHPDWEPLDGAPLLPKDDATARDFFVKTKWQENVDVKRQMELDPSGNTYIYCLLSVCHTLLLFCFHTNRCFDDVLERAKTHAPQQEGGYLESAGCNN